MIEIYPRVKKKETAIIAYEINQDYDGVFNDFYNKLRNKEHINWDFFFYRLNKLKIIPTDNQEDFLNKGALAEYGLRFNQMRIMTKQFKSAVMHEIFHLASSVVSKNCIYSGFQQWNRKSGIIIGIGLNEGYTNLLDKRYFGDYVPEKSKDLEYTYMISTSIAALLENFVGQENMERWYFTADLDSLVDYLSKYISRDECVTFLLAMDNVFKLVDKGKVQSPWKAAKNYQYIINFLGRCYMNLYLDEYYQGAYGKKELKERLEVVRELMERRLEFTKLRFPLTKKISKEDFRAYVIYEKNKVLQKCA